jgi:DNA polymerase-3 subunit alpha
MKPDETSGRENWTPAQQPIDLRPDRLKDPIGYRVLSESLRARDMAAAKGRRVCMYGYLVTVKSIRTVRGERMAFGCFIDYEGYYLDTIHFPPCLKAFPFRGVGVYRLDGKVVDEFGFLSLEVTTMEKLPLKSDPRASRK